LNAKNALRNTAARLLFAAGVTLPRRRARGALSIVTFHRVLPEAERRAYPYPGLVVTPAELDALLGYFDEHFDCGTLAGQHDRLRRGGPGEKPLLAITFDDAQVDNYRHARPGLARFGIKATFFVPVVAVECEELLWHDRLGFAVLALLGRGPAGRELLLGELAGVGLGTAGARSVAENAVREAKKLDPIARIALTERLALAAGSDAAPEFARLMTFGELADLAADGHEIGSHSMTHRMMPECSDGELAYELGESRRTLQRQLGQAIESFCFPNGDSDARTARAVADAGYLRAVTTDWGDNPENADCLRLRRYDMVAAGLTSSDGRIAPTLVALQMSTPYGWYRRLRQAPAY
jgi:peptidoglycan/xylan/chitin deacetylase (PgdA/CDA1 family)